MRYFPALGVRAPHPPRGRPGAAAYDGAMRLAPLCAAVALVALAASACTFGTDSDSGGGGQAGGGGAPSAGACGPAEQEACALLATVATYIERMKADCGGLYAVPDGCTAAIYYDDVEAYAQEADGVDLPGSAMYVTVDDDLGGYLAGLSGTGSDGEDVYCSVSNTDPVPACEPL